MSESLWLVVMPQCIACAKPMANKRDLPKMQHGVIKRGQEWCWRQVGISCAAWRIYTEWKERRKEYHLSLRNKRRNRVYFGPGYPPSRRADFRASQVGRARL